MFPFPNRDASVHRDWPADVRYVAAKDGARIAEKGELGVALGNDRPLAFIRVQILVKTTVNDKRQKARIPATKLQWLPARHAILTSGSGRTLDGRESLRAGRDAQLLPCRPAVRYPGPNAHTGPDGRTSVNQPSPDIYRLGSTDTGGTGVASRKGKAIDGNVDKWSDGNDQRCNIPLPRYRQAGIFPIQTEVGGV